MFIWFVDELTDIMNPHPGKNSVLVMENCQIHHVPEVEEVCAEKYMSPHCFVQTNEAIRGIKLLYLPPYSLDYNPIEEFFLAYKAFLQHNSVDFQLAVESGGGCTIQLPVSCCGRGWKGEPQRMVSTYTLCLKGKWGGRQGRYATFIFYQSCCMRQMLYCCMDSMLQWCLFDWQTWDVALQPPYISTMLKSYSSLPTTLPDLWPTPSYWPHSK